MLIIRCPSCGRQLRLGEDSLGQSCRCPACQTVFKAAEDEGADAPSPHVAAGPAPGQFADEAPPRQPRRRERFEDDYDDRREPRGERRQRARDAVAAPAICLMVIGGLAIALSLCSLGSNIALGGLAAGGGNFGGRPGMPVGAGGRGAMINLISGVVGAVLGLCWGSVVLTGAMRMKNLRGYGFAMTGAIVAMLPCNACCLLGLPVGIWALVTITNEEVRRGFA